MNLKDKWAKSRSKQAQLRRTSSEKFEPYDQSYAISFDNQEIPKIRCVKVKNMVDNKSAPLPFFTQNQGFVHHWIRTRSCVLTHYKLRSYH